MPDETNEPMDGDADDGVRRSGKGGRLIPEHAEAPKTEFLLYQTADGQNRIEVRFEGDTAWLSQKLLADLYQVTVSAINQHIKAIYEDQELAPEATIKKYLIVQNGGGREIKRTVDYFNVHRN